MDEQTTNQVSAETYEPAVVTGFGSVTGATLGNKQHDPADDTQYWNAS
ncbi:hypothetical protein [Streptomyces sp. XH2]